VIIEAADPRAQPSDLAQFVEKHKLLFHEKSWLACYPPEALTQAIIRNKNREVIGCFIYYVFKRASFDFIITPPFSPDSALFYVNPAESTVSRNSFSKDLMGAIADHFKKQKAVYLSLNFPREINDVQPLLWKGFYARTRYTYHLHLHRSEEELWANLSSEKRKSLNKASKDGLEIKPTNDAELVYRMITKSLSRNKKDKNLTVIRNITKTYCTEGKSIAYVAYVNGEPVAATFCLIGQKKATYLFGGYDAVRAHHGAGVSCMWRSILEAKARGLELFDFEGSMDKNIERYFREFGPELVPYHCVEKIRPLMKLLLNIKGHHPL
jgi:lipid II:glycine glycyltransferase (peptidoglycan interpeptide bridge formation enzyme)